MNIVLSVALPPEHYSPEKATVEIEPHSPHQEQGKQVDVGSPPRRSVYAIEKTAPFMGWLNFEISRKAASFFTYYIIIL